MLHVTSRVRRRLAATLVVGTVLLSGCGGDGDGADPAESPSAASDVGGTAGEGADVDEDAGADGEDTAEAADDDGSGDDSDEAASADDAAPATTLEALAPPGVVAQGDIVGGTIYTSDAPFEDVVAHYETVVGEANFVNEEEVAAVWVGEVASTSISVALSPGEGGTVDVLVAERP